MGGRMSKKIALGGLMGALALVILLMGGLIPVATFCAPALSGMVILIAAAECGLKLGWTLYLAVALLGLLLVPDKELAMVFAFLLGYYPLFKVKLEKLRPRLLRAAAKAAVFNGALAAAYGLLLTIFPIASLKQELDATTQGFAALLIALGNLTFWVYDLALVRVVQLYNAKLRPRLRRLY